MQGDWVKGVTIEMENTGRVADLGGRLEVQLQKMVRLLFQKYFCAP